MNLTVKMNQLRPPCCILHKLHHHPVESIEQENPPWVRGEELKPKCPTDNSDILALPILQGDNGGLFLGEREVNSELSLMAHFDC